MTFEFEAYLPPGQKSAINLTGDGNGGQFKLEFSEDQVDTVLSFLRQARKNVVVRFTAEIEGMEKPSISDREAELEG